MVVIAAVLLPNLAVLVVPFEHFPLSSAPMFAHYVGDETPRFRFRFVVESMDGGGERELQARQIGLRNVELARHFLGSVYGSVDPSSPYGHFRDDTPEAFEARMTDFLGRLVAALRRAEGDAFSVSGIRVELARLDERNSDSEVRVVGRYEASAGRFVHLWHAEP